MAPELSVRTKRLPLEQPVAADAAPHFQAALGDDRAFFAGVY